MAEEKKIVVPGNRLGVIEEYIPGEGTYEENGELFSSRVGVPSINSQSRKLTVEGSKRVAVPEVGDYVEGVVVSMKEDAANIRILEIKGKKPLTGVFSGVLHVSQAARGYVESLTDAVSLGDRILAKVLTSWSPYQLTTASDDLGVLYSTCRRCGTELVLRRGRLFCDRDRIVEKRKIARNYAVRGE